MVSFLIDIDGVLVKGNTAIPGAVETVSLLRKNHKCLLVTNTTRLSTQQLYEKLKKIGFEIPKDSLHTAVDATIEYIQKQKPGARCFLILEGGAREDFEKAGLQLVEEKPDFVVIGMDRKVDYNKLDRAFRAVQSGAQMLACHVLMFFPTEDGLHLGPGLFVKAMEFVTGKEAPVIGKPNPRFFEAGLHHLGSGKEETIMIGDDIFGDIQGAQQAGLRTIFIEGTYSKKDLEKNGIKPDFVLGSIAELQEILDQL